MSKSGRYGERALGGARESCHVTFDCSPSFVVRGGWIVADDHIADDQNGVAETIDRGEGTPDVPDHLRQAAVVGRRCREPLDVANGVVREVADEALRAAVGPLRGIRTLRRREP